MKRFTSKTINFTKEPLTAISTGYQGPVVKAIAEIKKEYPLITACEFHDDYSFNHKPSRHAYRGKPKRDAIKGKDDNASEGEASQDTQEGDFEAPAEGDLKDAGESSSKN
ncbi:hypothetical protein PG984_012981 [Apiospora sp. TS-2023a]